MILLYKRSLQLFEQDEVPSRQLNVFIGHITQIMRRNYSNPIL